MSPIFTSSRLLSILLGVGSGHETTVRGIISCDPRDPAPTKAWKKTKMAERAPDPTGSVKIPSSGETTPEYNAVRKSYGEIDPAIIRDDFVRRAHSCVLLPSSNPSSPPLEVVLKEISRDPVNYYCLQHVITDLNVENRFDKGIGKMEETFQCKDIWYEWRVNWGGGGLSRNIWTPYVIYANPEE